jgi:hypothetical protein
VPPKLDKFLVRVLATFQLLGSMVGFLVFLSALNYGGAAANPGLLPEILLYFFFGFVSALLLYSTLTFARILGLIWHALLLGVVIVG